MYNEIIFEVLWPHGLHVPFKQNLENKWKMLTHLIWVKMVNVDNQRKFAFKLKVNPNMNWLNLNFFFISLTCKR